MEVKFIQVSVEEMASQKKEILAEFIAQITKHESPLNLNYWQQMLTRDEAAADLGISLSTIDKWRAVKAHPIAFVGSPPRISRAALRKWHRKYSNIYCQEK